MGVFSGVFSSVSTAGNAYVQSKAQRAQADYQKKVANLNADYASVQAGDVVKQGELAAAQKQQNTRLQLGDQRAAAAASGADVNSEGIQDNLQRSEVVSAADEAAIKSNAWRQAFGIQAQAIIMRDQGQMNYNAGNFAARSTMITGGIQSVGYGVQAYGASNESATRAKPTTTTRTGAQ